MSIKKELFKILFWFAVIVGGFVLAFYWNGYRIGVPMLLIWWGTGALAADTTRGLSRNIDGAIASIEKVLKLINMMVK